MPEHKQINVSFTPDQYEQIDYISDVEGKSLAATVRLLTLSAIPAHAATEDFLAKQEERLERLERVMAAARREARKAVADG